MKVLFVQPDIRAYRVGFFNALSEKIPELTVLHFGETPDQVLLFQSLVGEKISLKGWHVIKNLSSIVKNYDVLVFGFDIHWMNTFAISRKYHNLIWWGHGKSKHIVANAVKRFFVKNAKACVAYDEKGKISYEDLGAHENRVFVAPNTLKVSLSEDFSQESKSTYLFVGRLQSRKRIDLLLKSFAKIQNELSDHIQIEIVGDGEMELKRLYLLSLDLQISDRVKFFPGTTDEAILKEHFKKALAYVSPGIVGLGALHSFAYGVPVVTLGHGNQAPEFSNLSHRINSLILNKPEELDSALLQLGSTDISSRLGKMAFHHFSQERTLNHMVKGFLDAFDTINKIQ
jgi:glycosyltransferase involved in cell wall biosynthesis